MKKLIMGALIIFAHGIALGNNSSALQKLQTNFNSFQGMGIRAVPQDFTNYKKGKTNNPLSNPSQDDVLILNSIEDREKTYINRMNTDVDKFTPSSYRKHKLWSIGKWATATTACLIGIKKLLDNNIYDYPNLASYLIVLVGPLCGLKTLEESIKCYNSENRIDELKSNWQTINKMNSEQK